MGNLLMGIDIGTSACKVAVFSTQGEVIASASSEYKTYYPQPMYVEQNPLDWWQGACDAIKQCLGTGKVNAQDIAAVGVDGQSWSAIAMDKKGNVLCNTPIWQDRRAKKLCEQTIERIGFDTIFDISRNPFEPAYSLPKILWYKENMPEIYNNAEVFLQSNSFIVYMLTGKYSQDKSQGYGLFVYDIKNSRYDQKMADILGVDLSRLPEIYECQDVVGTITKKASEQCLLNEGTPVVAGGLDSACGALGAGVYEVGNTQEQGGQAGGMNICMDRPIAHKKLILSSHVIPNLWLLQGGSVAGGGALNWLKREFGAQEAAEAENSDMSVFEIMSHEAGTINPGADGLVFLPYLAGERSPLWDENAKGVFFGLSFDKTRAHMIRAVMEGVAFSLLHNIDTAKDVGANIFLMNSIGGSANSKVWTQIKSDICGIPINVPASDTATTWGAAILAGVGCGILKSFDSAINQSIKIKRRHEPDMINHELYMNYYEIYREIYEKLKDTMKKI